MEKRLEESFSELGSSLKSISSLVAWKNLKMAERRPGGTTSFQMYDPTEAEIKIEMGFFLKTSTNIRIASEKLPASKKVELHRRLSILEADFNHLLRSEKLKSD